MNASSHRPRASPYLVVALVAIAAPIVGFIPTYFAPMASGETFSLTLHVHGLFGAAWFALYLTQTLLIHRHSFRIHRTLGLLGIPVAFGVVITTQMAGVELAEKGLGTEKEAILRSMFLGPFIDSLAFGGLVLLGISNRAKGEVHKRLMLLATIYLLWVAWFRMRHYFPAFPGADFVFSVIVPNLLILAVWAHEKRRTGVIHPAILFGGLAVIGLHLLQTIFFHSAPWQFVATRLLDVMPY